MRDRSRPASTFQTIEAILRNPATYRQAEVIPQKSTGRPRDYPAFVWVLFEALVTVYQSARRVETELGDPRVWNFIREILKEVFPNDPSKELPDRPMARHHYLYSRRYLADADVLERRREIHTEDAVKLARQIGLLDPNGPGSLTHPHLTRMLYGDGTVLPPLFKGKPGETRVDRETGEVVSVRHEPDASLHFEGDGEEAYGTKFSIVSARSETDRVILDLRFVPAREGGEAAVALRSFSSIALHDPGVCGVIWDMELRGTHIDQVQRDLGWLVVTRVPAASSRARRRRRGAFRKEKESRVEVKEITGPDGQVVKVPFFTRGGALGIARLDELGNRVFVRLERVQILRRGRPGRFRFYGVYRLPDDSGEALITVRLGNTPEDQARRYNRAENLRPIPPGDPDFERLYRRRKDAESIHRHLKDSMFLRRAHSVGHARQQADLFGYALMVNSLTLARHRDTQRLVAA